MSFPRLFGGRYRTLAVILAGALGALASIGVFVFVGLWQHDLAESNFRNQAADRLRIINAGFEDANVLLHTLVAYFESADHPIEQDEFQRFSRTLLSRVAGLHDVAWAPHILSADRPAFESAMQATGHPGFQIAELNAAQQLTRAADRPDYYPVIYNEGASSSRLVFGLDLGSRADRRAALERATRTGAPAVTPPVDLRTVAQPRGDYSRTLACAAVTTPASPPGRRRAWCSACSKFLR